MSLASYSDLQTAIANWIARTDLTDRIPEFIALAEAKFNRNLEMRQMEQRATASVDTTSTSPEFITLPGDFQSMRRICLGGVEGKPTLEYLSPTQLYDMRSKIIGDGTGQPEFFTIVGDEMELLPIPDQDYSLEMVYRKNIPALADNDTNWLLTLAPDAYLYGSLMEASIFMAEDDRVPLWAQAYTSVIDSLADLNISSAYSAGPPTMRLSSGITP